MQIKTWQEGEYFVSQCLEVDVSSFGKTKQEAVQNLQEAVELYLEMEASIEKVRNDYKNGHFTTFTKAKDLIDYLHS